MSTNHKDDSIKTDDEMMFGVLTAFQTLGPYQKIALAKSLSLLLFVSLFVLLWHLSQKLPVFSASFVCFFSTFAVVIEGIYLQPVSKTIPVSRQGGEFGRETRRCVCMKWFEMRVFFHF